MCQKCVDAIKKYWPDLPEEDWRHLLWGATPYPCGSAEDVVQAIRQMAERSGCDVGLACAIADTELERDMEAAAIAAAGEWP